jgi:hypothetical protein
MENPSIFRDFAVTARSSHADGVSRRFGGPLLVTAALGMIALFTGWKWFGASAALPLLYILPCAVMMAMCMRGHGASGSSSTTPNNSAGSGPNISQ